MNPTPKMRTSAPLSPEQIRAIIHADQTTKKQRNQTRIRNLVRVAFWTTITLATLALLAHYQLLPDDYRDTCEALGQACGK